MAKGNMSRAEERAEAYEKSLDYYHCMNDWPSIAYRAGYEQAEKDIKEWIDEQLTILDKQTLLHPDDDVFWAHRNLFKEMKDKINSL